MNKVNEIFYTRHSGGLTMFKDGKQLAVSNTHPNFDRILVCLSQKKWDDVAMLMSIKDTINTQGVSHTSKDRKVFVENGKVYYIDSHKKQRELAGPLVDRILDDIGKKSALRFGDALLAFMDNIQKNTLKDIRAELYEFLMSGKTPITMDGCFLAYKLVRDDFLDHYTGKMDNSPGKIVRMPQEKVNRDRHNTCSVGLHFCSKNYLSQYSSGIGRIIVVKVNPRYVFAIPTDYQNQKGRASEYFVVGELRSTSAKDLLNHDAFKNSFIDEDTKEVDAPDVTFVKGGLKPSLEAIAESYGIVNDGQVKVVTGIDGKYIPVKQIGVKLFDIIGTPVSDVGLKTMSFETKSIRAAVKAAVAKASKS